MSPESEYFASPMVEVAFSIANGAALKPDLELVVRNETGLEIGRLTPATSVVCRLPRMRPVFRFGPQFASQRFRLSRGVTAARMMWDGRRWLCAEAIEEESPTASPRISRTAPEERVSLTSFGAAGLVVGLIWAVIAFNMKVSVSSYYLSDEVVNLDLIQRRNLHFGGAGLLLICSLITTFFGMTQVRTTSTNGRSSERESPNYLP